MKKFGVSGTIAYVLTELAFWAVAFPVAAALFTQANGHAPDLFNSGEDRAAVIASIFVGANVARLAVPLRFGVALAAAPWVDENIVQRFGGDSVDVEAVVEEVEEPVAEESGFSMPELPRFLRPFDSLCLCLRDGVVLWCMGVWGRRGDEHGRASAVAEARVFSFAFPAKPDDEGVRVSGHVPLVAGRDAPVSHASLQT